MEQTVLHVCQEALSAILVISAPPALAAVIVGLLVAVVQTATQVQEQTASYLPKLLAVCLSLVVAGGWMLSALVRFAVSTLERIPDAGGW